MQRYQGEAALRLNGEENPCCIGTCLRKYPENEEEKKTDTKWQLPEMPEPEQSSDICQNIIFLKMIDEALHKSKTAIKYALFIQEAYGNCADTSFIFSLNNQESSVGNTYCPVALKFMLEKARISKDKAYKMCRDLSQSPFARNRYASEDAKKELSSTFLLAKIETSFALQLIDLANKFLEEYQKKSDETYHTIH